MARAGIRPPFDAGDDALCYMWALSWADNHEWATELSEPIPGCIMVFTREGGGYVAMLEKIEGNTAWIRGFNQSDTVNMTTRSMDSSFVAAMWPNGFEVLR